MPDTDLLSGNSTFLLQGEVSERDDCLPAVSVPELGHLDTLSATEYVVLFCWWFFFFFDCESNKQGPCYLYMISTDQR